MHTETLNHSHAVTLDPELVRRWRETRAAAVQADADAESVEKQLLELLGSADVGTVDGKPVVYREVRVRAGIDLTRLRKARPELWTEYATQRSRTRLVPSPE